MVRGLAEVAVRPLPGRTAGRCREQSQPVISVRISEKLWDHVIRHVTGIGITGLGATSGRLGNPGQIGQFATILGQIGKVLRIF